MYEIGCTEVTFVSCAHLSFLDSKCVVCAKLCSSNATNGDIKFFIRLHCVCVDVSGKAGLFFVKNN